MINFRLSPGEICEFIHKMSGIPLRDPTVTTDTKTGGLMFNVYATFADREKLVSFPLAGELDAIAMELRRINENNDWGPSA